MSYRVKMILPVVGMFLLGCAVVAAVREESRGIKNPFPESSAPLTAFTGGTFEASGVAHVPGTDGVLFVDDGREDEVFWMRLGEGGKPAGLRTHMLVTLGTAVFVLACSGVGMSSDGLSRVIQGIVTGIGFLGAGSILKLNNERDIQGLTTAAGIWMTAAIGVAVGLGSLGVAVLSTVFTLIILTLAGLYEFRAEEKREANIKGRDRA